MKPKNKFQERVLALSKIISPITKAQKKWGYHNCIEHIGRRTKKGVISCLECGHLWTDKTTKTHCVCPNCNTKLTINDTTKRVFEDYQYLCIVTTCKEFQVLRFIYIDYRAKVGEKAKYYHSEVVQRWIAPDGKYTSLAKTRPMGYFVHTWTFSSSLEVRPEKPLYNINPTCFYSRQKLIPEIKRSGFTGVFYDLTPFDLLHYLLTESKAETLMKSKQTNLLRYFAYNTSRKIANYWASIRICIRNNYKIEDVSIWCDYIDLLRFFNKDLHNAKYVCPADLKSEHDKYVKKKQAYLEKQRREETKKRAIEHEATYKDMKSKFFGIQFSDGLIQIKVLESVDEIMREGEALHHCIFANEYHLRADSLLLSACINDERLETIEFSLSKLQVLQSRGVCNKNTDYHDRILKLVKKNVPQIRKRIHNKQHQNLSTAI